MKNKIAWIIILFASLFFSSCEKFVDVNQNPNNPTTVPPKPLKQKITNPAIKTMEV